MSGNQDNFALTPAQAAELARIALAFDPDKLAKAISIKASLTQRQAIAELIKGFAAGPVPSPTLRKEICTVVLRLLVTLRDGHVG